MKRLVFAVGLVLGTSCYATTSTPPGPSCSADPSNPACYPPVHDKTKPDGGVK